MNYIHKPLIKLIIISLFFGQRCGLMAQVKKSDIDKTLVISSLEHPYLYFNETDKKKLIERINSDQESKENLCKMKDSELSGRKT